MGNTVSTNGELVFDEKLYTRNLTELELNVPPLPAYRRAPVKSQSLPTYLNKSLQPENDVPLLVVKRQSEKRPRAVTQPVRIQTKTVESAPAQRIANSWRRSIDPYVKRTVSCPQGPPTLDFDSIPVLQPDSESSDSETLSPASFEDTTHFENPAGCVYIHDSSPHFSHYGSVYNEEDFDFLAASRVNSPVTSSEPIGPQNAPVRPKLLRRASSPASPSRSTISRSASSVYSRLSMGSLPSVRSTKSEPVRRDSLDTGIPPQVPPHRFLRGRPASMALPAIPVERRPRAKSDAGRLPFDIYTRKCRLMSPETSPVLASRLASRSSSASPSSNKSAEPTREIHRFALDGYDEKAPLQVVNKDPASAHKFYIKSKAMIAEEQERLQNEFYARQF